MHLAGSNYSASSLVKKYADLWKVCLVSRRLSIDVNLFAKEGGKEKTGEAMLRLSSFSFLFPWCLALSYLSVAIRACLCSRPTCEKKKKRITWGGEVCSSYHVKAKFICYLLLIEAYNNFSSTSRWFLGRLDLRPPLSWLRSCSTPRRYLGLTPSEQRAAGNQA